MSILCSAYAGVTNKKTNSLIHNQTKDLTTENISKPSNMEINLDQVDYNRKPIDDSLKEDKNTIVQIPDVSLSIL